MDINDKKKLSPVLCGMYMYSLKLNLNLKVVTFYYFCAFLFLGWHDRSGGYGGGGFNRDRNDRRWSGGGGDRRDNRVGNSWEIPCVHTLCFKLSCLIYS